MPKLIKDGAVVEDSWQGSLLNLDEFNAAAASGTPAGVVLQPDQPPSALEADLAGIEVIAINFPVFTDGRGFSYARELRQRGYRGEIRAVGDFIRDQLGYLQRCGFDAFEFADDSSLEECLPSLREFSESYQADMIQADPLFRRR